MAFTYAAGTTAPGFGGLAELPSLRINQGSFRPISIPPLNETMPLRVKSTPAPRGGAFVDPPLPDAWAFDLSGFFVITDPNDVQAAIEYLRAHVNAYLGWMTLTLNAIGWAATRQMTVQINGQVSTEDVEIDRKKVPRRGFVLPLIAADPRIYSTLQATTVIGTGTSVANAGTTPAPFTVRFHAPQTDPQINGPGAGNIIKFTGAILGSYVDVTTVDASTGTMTAVDDSGNNVFANITADSANYLNPGSSAWTATRASGAGATEILHRDAWG